MVVVVVVVGDGSVVHLLLPLLTRTFASSSSSCPSLDIEFSLSASMHGVVTVVCGYLSYYCPIKISKKLLKGFFFGSRAMLIFI
jgi:hypothetical protein